MSALAMAPGGAPARTLAGAAAVAAWLAGCDWSLERMVDQPRCERDQASALFASGTCNQLPPEGAVPWPGAGGGAEPAASVRPPVTRALLARGQDRFDIFCAPCHGPLADGRSQVAENMLLRRPPSLHEPRIVALDDERVLDVISRGYGLMPAYAHVPVPDRWAIVAWVRVLQLSQDVPLDRLPPAIQEEARPWLP